MMKLTILIDNSADSNNRLETEHGLSIHIEFENHKILCDMGASNKYAHNAKILGINLDDIDLATISHGHNDHTGGLGNFLNTNRNAPIYLSDKIFGHRFYSSRHNVKRDLSTDNDLQYAGSDRFRYINNSTWIDNNIAIICNKSREYKFPEANRFLTVSDIGNNISGNSHSEKSAKNIVANHIINSDTYSTDNTIDQDCETVNDKMPENYDVTTDKAVENSNNFSHKTTDTTGESVNNFSCKTTDTTSESANNFSCKTTDTTVESANNFSCKTTDTTVYDKAVERADDFSHEISLALKTDHGLVIISCCSHCGAMNIIDSCRRFTGIDNIHAFIGGLHFIDHENTGNEVASFLKTMTLLTPNINIYTGHCTGDRAKRHLATQQSLPKINFFHTGDIIKL